MKDLIINYYEFIIGIEYFFKRSFWFEIKNLFIKEEIKIFHIHYYR